MRQYAALRETQERDYKEVQEIIEYMNAKQSRLRATMERKQKLMSGGPEGIRRKLFQAVLVLEDRISAVETELLVASEEMRELKVEKERRKRREGFRYCRSLWWL